MHSLPLTLALLTLSSLSPVSPIMLPLPQTPLDTDTSSPAHTQKLVVAHFIVGNTYPYTVQDWTRDITLASSKGIDAFALNVGRDPWQPDRVADAFTAARALPPTAKFKLFLSFDMSSLPCTQASDADPLRTYITTYHTHPNHLIYLGKSLVSTFAGEQCTFGSNLNDGWTSAIKSAGLPPVYFVPAFFVDPKTFPSLTVMDGAFNWNSAWPIGDNDITVDPDNAYVSNLGGRTYMAGVSPWFFTHYGPDTYAKNFIYRADDWLPSERFELLIHNRHSVTLAQLITWNDYGESHYVGPIHGAQPGSEKWVDGFDHTGWLDMIEYYIQAFKTGVYPDIERDRVFLWARLYPAGADAPDPIGRPDNWNFTQDFVWGVVFLTSPAHVTLSCGSSNQTMSLRGGVSKVRLGLVVACRVEARITRGGVAVLRFAPSGFEFQMNPPSYNFNAFVAASP